MGVDDDLYDLIAIELGEPPRMLLQAREAAAADALEWMNRRMAALNLPETRRRGRRAGAVGSTA